MNEPDEQPSPPLVPAEPTSPQDFFADLATPSWELVEKSDKRDGIETR